MLHMKEMDFFVTQTWYKYPKRRLYTWKAPRDRNRKQWHYTLLKHRLRNTVKVVHTLVIDRKRKMLYKERSVQSNVKLQTFKCSGNIYRNECQTGNTMRGFIVKHERKAKKQCFTQEMISKMDERRKQKNVDNEEERRILLGNGLKSARGKRKKEYLESICDEIREFLKMGRYVLIYMKTKQIGWKEKALKNKLTMSLERSVQIQKRKSNSVCNCNNVRKNFGNR